VGGGSVQIASGGVNALNHAPMHPCRSWRAAIRTRTVCTMKHGHMAKSKVHTKVTILQAKQRHVAWLDAADRKRGFQLIKQLSTHVVHGKLIRTRCKEG